MAHKLTATLQTMIIIHSEIVILFDRTLSDQASAPLLDVRDGVQRRPGVLGRGRVRPGAVLSKQVQHSQGKRETIHTLRQKRTPPLKQNLNICPQI